MKPSEITSTIRGLEPRADREVVLTAMRQDWRALKYASEELQADSEVVLAQLDEEADVESGYGNKV